MTDFDEINWIHNTNSFDGENKYVNYFFSKIFPDTHNSDEKYIPDMKP